MRISDTIPECAAFVTYEDDGEMRYGGTAFLVGVPSRDNPESIFIHVVTARHVVAKIGDRPTFLRMNLVGGDADFVSLGNAHWWFHPSDSAADVAVLPARPPDHFDYAVVALSDFLDEPTIESRQIGIGDEVAMTGLFSHLVGKSRILPIVRWGNIAMMPTEKVPSAMFGDMDAYLVEARSLGGLSGSPAFVIESRSLGGLRRMSLLGLVHGHWETTLPTGKEANRNSFDELGPVNVGIAIVVPAKKIREVIEQPDLIEFHRKHAPPDANRIH
jgi:hypothetical protein